MSFDALGTWRLRYSLGGSVLVDAPLEAVAAATPVRNRAPYGITVALSSTAPSAHVPVVCTVGTALASRDPDYDIVRYRYSWTAGGRSLRAVTSAGLTDVLARDVVRPGETISCSVTPSDGRLSGATASASAVATG